MPTDRDLRSRVERLLGGQFREGDLHRLFLTLRRRAEPVFQEVGDFVAHADERRKGIVTRAVHDFFVLLQHHIPTLGQAIYSDDLPPEFPELLQVVLRLLDDPELIRRTAMNAAAARRCLKGFLAKLSRKPDGRWALIGVATFEEERLVNCLAHTIPTRSAFDEGRLFTDFCRTLERQQLLKPAEQPQLKWASTPISLFAVTYMHGCTIVLSDGSSTELQAGASPDGVTVDATWPAANGGGFRLAMFTTNARPEDWCDPRLVAEGTGHWRWECGLELSSDLKLAPLGV